MPSPFPGMDPYLEAPGLWPDVHHRLINIASDMIAERVRPKYFVRIEERVYISDESGEDRSGRSPDVRIAAVSGREAWSLQREGGAAIDLIEPMLGTPMIDEEVHEAYLTIVDRASRSVVTFIEILSPSNKKPGSSGRVSFEQKRQEVMNSPSHWVEIDLLRVGVGVRIREPLPPHEYLVHVSPVDRRPKGLLWPIRLSQRLPAITIPLRPEDPDAALDLQAVIATAYDRAGYDLSVDYARDPVPPLTGEWPAWADALLKDKGLRNSSTA